jgi:hypothetical protein
MFCDVGTTEIIGTVMEQEWNGQYGNDTIWYGFLYSWYVLVRSVRFCTVSYGLVRFGTVRYGSVRFGTVCADMVLPPVVSLYHGTTVGTVSYGLVRFSTVWYGLVRFGAVLYGFVRFGTVWYGWYGWYGFER